MLAATDLENDMPLSLNLSGPAGDPPSSLPPGRRRGWWPWLLAALLVAADLLLAHLHRGRLAGWVETGLALDMMLVLPLLLAWSARGRGRKAMIVRGLSGLMLGSVLLLWAIPPHERTWTQALSGWRWLGMAVMAALEVGVAVAMVRALRCGTSAQALRQELEQSQGMPAWAARLMAWEVSFWRAAGQRARSVTRWLRALAGHGR